MAKLLTYTRLPQDDRVYANRLAYSMHLAIQSEGIFKPLNHNSGVLFAKATENEDGSLNPKSLKNPWMFPLREGGYGVIAIRTLAEGEADNENVGCAILWTTKNLLAYKEIGAIKLDEVNIVKAVMCYEKDKDAYAIKWQTADGKWYASFVKSLEDILPSGDSFELTLDAEITEADSSVAELIASDYQDMIEGVQPCNIVEITDTEAEYLMKKLITPVNVGVEMPDAVMVKSKEEAEKVKAALTYSDGSRVLRKVMWNLENVDFSKPGRYPVTGTVKQEHFAFPIAENRADPCVTCWQGKYYFIATNDADNNHTLYIRQADDLEGLVTAEEHLILDSVTYPGIGGLLWAPEFHEINNRLYIFHAATPDPFFCEESHIMELKEGGDPTNRNDWSCPKRIVKADGSDLCESGKTISLDMTHFVWEGRHYVIWSQRQFLPKDLGAWLYIAELNSEKPWMLKSEPVILSKPDYGWANNHTFVDEGPYALTKGKNLYITFSSAAVDSTYVVGLLKIEPGKDLLVRENWTKSNYPILTSRSVEGEFGTGHNAYVMDEEGLTWNTYHARPGLDAPRSSGIRRVHFDIDGEPMLDVTEEMDMLEKNKMVKTVLVI